MAAVQLQAGRCKGSSAAAVHKPADEEQAEKPPGKIITNEKDWLAKLNWHLLPTFFAMTVLCYLDRTNLAFAAVQLNNDLGFTESVYGLGAGIFFLGYCLFQVPSNLVLAQLGAPVWLTVLVVSWGCVGTSFAALRNAQDFYVLRFMLGVAESGVFPGMWFHMSLFYTEQELGLAYSYVTAGTALSQVFGAPLAAVLLSLDGLLGLRGWQWLFIAEGLPTVALGLALRRALPETPARATFLLPEERDFLVARSSRMKNAARTPLGSPGIGISAWSAARDARIWHLAAVSLLESTVKNAILYWCPLVIYSLIEEPSRQTARLLLQDSKASLHQQHPANSGAAVALLTALPYGLAAAWMLGIAGYSQATGKRRAHITLPFLAAAFCLALVAVLMDTMPAAAFFALLGATVLWGPAGIIYSLPATFLQGPAAATGVAIINSIGNLGGMVGPFLVGTLHHRYNSYSLGVGLLAAITLATGALVAAFPLAPPPGPEPPLSKRTSDVAVLLESYADNADVPPAKRARNARLVA